MLNNRSESLNEIFSALAKAQSEMGVAGHNAANPHYKSKFSDMTELVRVSRPALAKHGLSVSNQIVPDAAGDHYMHCVLGHSSGQWIETRIRLSPDKSDIQSLGKYITYLRRYTYSSLVGVVSSGEDDDGESLMVETRNSPQSTYAAPRSALGSAKPVELITLEQLDMLDHELMGHPDMVDGIKKKKGISELKNLKKSDFQEVFDRVRELKLTRDGR